MFTILQDSPDYTDFEAYQVVGAYAYRAVFFFDKANKSYSAITYQRADDSDKNSTLDDIEAATVPDVFRDAAEAARLPIVNKRDAP